MDIVRASPKLDLTTLDKGEKLAAAVYVLSRPDLPIPPPPTPGAMIELGKDDLRRSLARLRDGEHHRFANLLGAIGGTTGGAFGAALGTLLDDRKAWTATLVGTLLGTYPPAIVGFAIDQLIDR